jgi:nucleotide-binding universal stress UspA family protein
MMSIILAALDATAAARPVLETALRVSELTGAQVEGVHVANRQPAADMSESLAAGSGVPYRLLHGAVLPALLSVMSAPDVLAAVIGARAIPSGRRPAGSTARGILERTDKPVVVVPPEAVSPRPIRRLLVPLEGTGTSSRPVIEHLQPLIATGVEVIVLHVFTEETLPAMLDRPEYDIEILGKEFLAHHFPHTTRIELRPGPVSHQVTEVSAEHEIDLIVLSWSQDSSAGRAKVVRDVLSASARPVLLLPAGSAGSGSSAESIAVRGSAVPDGYR